MKKIIKIPIIDCRIELITAATIELGLQLADLKPNGKSYSALVVPKSSHFATLLFEKDNITPGLIVHECKHILNIFFEGIGQDLDLQNDELECYFLQYIFEQVNKTLNVKN